MVKKSDETSLITELQTGFETKELQSKHRCMAIRTWLISFLGMGDGEGVVDVNVKDDQEQNALHLACTNGHKDIVLLLLLDKRIDMAHKDKYGRNALHVATRKWPRGHCENPSRAWHGRA